MTKPCCTNCKFWQDTGAGWGTCRLYPPQPEWARTRSDEWCGKFKSAAPAQKMPKKKHMR